MKTRIIIFLSLWFLIPSMSCAESLRDTLLSGIYATEEGNYSEAIEYLDAVLAQVPDQADALAFRAKAKAGLEEYESALADVNRAIEESLHFAEAYRIRSEIYEALDRTEEAQQDKDKAHDIVNSGIDRILTDLDERVSSAGEEPTREKGLALLKRADHKYLTGNYTGAAKDYDAALAILGSFPKAQNYSFMASAKSTYYDYTGSIDAYTKGLTKFPDTSWLRRERALTFKKMNNIQGYEADMAILREDWLRERRDREVELADIIQRRPTAESYKLRAQARLDIGNYQGALEDINKAIELDPEDAWRYEYIKTKANFYIKHPEKAPIPPAQ